MNLWEGNIAFLMPLVALPLTMDCGSGTKRRRSAARVADHEGRGPARNRRQVGAFRPPFISEVRLDAQSTAASGAARTSRRRWQSGQSGRLREGGREATRPPGR